jgi:hypothetical protein
MQPNPDKVRSNLGELAAMAAQTEEMERKILKMATERLSAVEQEIEQARGDAFTNAGAAENYQKLITERGTLNQVIAKAKAILSQS